MFRYPVPATPTREEAQGETAVRGSEHFHRWLHGAHADVVHFHTFVTGLGLAEIIAASLKPFQKTMSRGAEEALKDRCGGNMRLIQSELEKLALYAEGPVIEAKDVALLLAPRLNNTYLAIQGPPGSGKTTIGAELILDLVKQGKRVGITANSHKVIGNLLDKTIGEARRRGQSVSAMQKADERDRCASQEVQCTNSSSTVEAASLGPTNRTRRHSRRRRCSVMTCPARRLSMPMRS